MWLHECGGQGACQRVNIFNTKMELGYGMHLEHLILIHTIYLIMPVVQWYHFLTLSINKTAVYSCHLIGKGTIHSQTPV
jgi:predicted membrane chloride channel (bestrophin family)